MRSDDSQAFPMEPWVWQLMEQLALKTAAALIS